MTDAKPTRRSFLTLLGLAPIVAPTIVVAAVQPAAVRLVGSTPFLGTGSRILLPDEVEPIALSAAETYRECMLLTWPEGPERDRLRAEWAEFMRARIVRTDESAAALRSTFASCPALIDDVGGGP